MIPIMKRDIYQKLLEWKSSHRRKPLLLQGARQTGKTFILKQFGGNEYEKIIYCNFEEDPGLDQFFYRDLNPGRILADLSIYMNQTIKKVGDDIETFDCFIPYGQRRQDRLTRAIRQSGKEDIGFFIHQFPYTKLLLSSSNPVEQHQSRLIIKEMITQAVAIGASSLTFASGPPSPANATDAHYAAFADFCRWLCGESKPHGITALIEPCDTTVHKKFLYGSTEACVKLVESFQPELNNFGILLDLSHVPLIGETFEQAIKKVAQYLKRVYLGNCVLKEKSHRLMCLALCTVGGS